MDLSSYLKNIVFDFGGVLMDWNPRYYYRKVFDNPDDMEYFLGNICTNEWNAQQDAGRPLEVATRILQEQHPEYHDLIQQYYDNWEVMLRDEIPHNTALLPQLNQHYRLFGLTNWASETFPIAYQRFPLFEIFEGIVVSGDEKMIKPDPALYGVLLQRYGLKAAESLFIDDNAQNIEVAEELGFQTIHCTPELDLPQHLKELGILNS